MSTRAHTRGAPRHYTVSLYSCFSYYHAHLKTSVSSRHNICFAIGGNIDNTSTCAPDQQNNRIVKMKQMKHDYRGSAYAILHLQEGARFFLSPSILVQPDMDAATIRDINAFYKQGLKAPLMVGKRGREAIVDWAKDRSPGEWIKLLRDRWRGLIADAIE